MMTNTMNTRDPIPARIDGDTPNLRLFALLEAIAQKNEPFTLQTMVEETGLPKPTMHRMLQQLEGGPQVFGIPADFSRRETIVV